MAARVRVLLDCRMATWTGVGRYTTGLARALAQMEEVELIQVSAAGEWPPVAAASSPDAVGGPPTAPQHISAAKHPFSLGGARELSRIARDVSADVIHCPHFPTPLPTIHPLVVTMHDLTPLVVPGIMPSVTKRLAYRWWNRRAVHVADRIITDAAFTVGEIERVFPLARGRVTAIPLGVDDFAAGPVGTLAGSLLALTENPYLLSMGSTRGHKDLPTLLSAFAVIAVQRPELRLLLVGAEDPGYLARELVNVPAPVRDRIAFTGRVDDNALRAIMAGAVAFAFPSRYEGFGLPPLEAMALGTPTVVASSASLPEVVGDGALTFAPGDAAGLAVRLGELLDDADLRARMRRAGLARSRELTWARSAGETVAVYRRVIGEG
ncbi:MAG: glycosyltransferase family 1 protein [Coriobacteriia bacterium]